MGTCEHNRPILHGKDARQTLPESLNPNEDDCKANSSVDYFKCYFILSLDKNKSVSPRKDPSREVFSFSQTTNSTAASKHSVPKAVNFLRRVSWQLKESNCLMN